MNSTAGGREQNQQQLSTGPAAPAAFQKGQDKMEQAHSNITTDGAGSNTRNTNGATLVRKGDARPHDVLMGRGHFNHPGNDRFLRIVSERRADYRAAKYADKQQIAQEVLELVLDPTYMSGGCGSGPTSLPPLPARYLQLESGDARTDDCVFRFASGKAIDAKVKMALRQKPKPQNNKKSTNGEQPEEQESFSASARDNGGQGFGDHTKFAAHTTAHDYLDQISSSADLLDGDVLLSRLLRFAEEDGTANLAQQAINDASASEESGPSASMDTAVGQNGPSSSGMNSTSLAMDGNLHQLLQFLRAAQQTLRPLREKYHGASSSNEICSDLHSLGKVLYSMLAMEHGDGSNPSSNVNMRSEDQSEGPLAKRDRRRGETESGRQALKGDRVPLQDLGYPTSLSIFVQSLIDATDEDAPERYQTICDVDNDLQLMIEYPDKYLFDPPRDTSTGRLDISSELYGVQSQQNKLMNAFQSVIVTGQERRGLALISGQSGTGKSSLVNTLCGPLCQLRGKMVQIKFEKKDIQSMTSIFRAFDQYCYELQGDLDLRAEVGDTVTTALGSTSQILLSQMPNLSVLVGEISSPLPNMDSKERYHLLLGCLQTFIRAISASSHPTVILFDDLQWADTEALGLFTKLVKDVETRSCLFVGCYRDNEVLADHPLLENLGVLADHPLLEHLGEITLVGMPIWQIFQGGIDKDATNELLSEALHLSPRITAPLASEIHKKTGGNPNFAKQLLQSFCDERLLQYSPSARRWQWDISAIRAKSVPDSAVSFLLERMSQYDPDVQQVLQVAALMGRRFDALALKAFQAGGDARGDGTTILAHIDTIVDDGLVCIDKAELRFAHDSIWEAATSLTPVAQREMAHLMIGRQMLFAANQGSPEILDVHLQLIVDQMNRGSELIQSHEERLRLAKLNLQVGQLALASCSFLEASLYLLQGIALLLDEDWEGSYNLCLEIFSACAEAQLAHGNHNGAIITANAVILHGRSLNDKLDAQYTICIALYTQGKVEDSCRKALSILEDLGIHFPSLDAPIEPAVVLSEVQRTETMLKSLRFEDIVGRPPSITKNLALDYTLKLLYNLCKALYLKKPDLIPLVASRMVQTCIEEAMTGEASIAFASYSLILCTFGLRDRSAECAHLSMALLDRFRHKYSQTVLLSCTISIHPYRQPWHACLESLERALHAATTVGDVSTAITCQSCPSSLYVFAFGTLQDAKRKLETNLQGVISSGHPNFYWPMVYLQLVLNLCGSAEENGPTFGSDADPTILRGHATNKKDILSALPQSNHQFYPFLKRKAVFCRMFLGYLFRRYDVLLAMCPAVKDNVASSKFYPAFEILLEKFYLGLAAYSIRRGCVDNNDIEQWQIIADNSTNEMKELTENDSKWNFQQKYFLLEAEKAFTKGDGETAAAFYDKAIEAAREHRFINEEALANECASVFHLEQGNIGQARKYLEQSKDLYQAWGAHRKVENILSLLSSME